MYEQRHFQCKFVMPPQVRERVSNCSRLCVHELLQHVQDFCYVRRALRPRFASPPRDRKKKKITIGGIQAGAHLHCADYLYSLLIYWFLTRPRQTYIPPPQLSQTVAMHGPILNCCRQMCGNLFQAADWFDLPCGLCRHEMAIAHQAPNRRRRRAAGRRRSHRVHHLASSMI